MAGKAPKFDVLFTGIATGINCHIGAPDTEAPEGASWKPNGKYKATLVFEPEDPDLLKLSAAFEAAGKKAFPAAETVELPFKEGKDGTRSAGKVLFTAQSTKLPECFDRRERKMDPEEINRNGDELRLKVALIPWEKEDEVKERISGKIVTTKTKVYGIAARIYGVQRVKARPEGAGGFGDLGDDPDGESGGFGANDAEDRVERKTSSGQRAAQKDADLDDDCPF